VAPPQDFCVTYHYGFSPKWAAASNTRLETFIGEGQLVKVPMSSKLFSWPSTRIAASDGIVEIRNNDRFFEDTNDLGRFIQGSKIELRAAEEQRPVIILPQPPGGDILITGGAGAELRLTGC